MVASDGAGTPCWGTGEGELRDGTGIPWWWEVPRDGGRTHE